MEMNITTIIIIAVVAVLLIIILDLGYIKAQPDTACLHHLSSQTKDHHRKGQRKDPILRACG